MQAAMTTTTPARMPTMRHPVTVAQALKFLELHGHSPIMTPDGILVVSFTIWTGQAGYPADDRTMDEMTTFPTVGNVVDLAPIREWQGY